MKKTSMILLMLLLCPSVWCVQPEKDSVSASSSVEYGFRWKRLVLPASLVAVGAYGVGNGWLQSLNRDVCRSIQEDRCPEPCRWDDYVQYVPVVSHAFLGCTGIPSKHGLTDRLMATAASYLSMGIMVNTLKFLVDEQRPDGSAHNSFPSGHTATAFMGAELVRLEYGGSSVWYGVGAYTMAAGVAFLRLYNNRHWCNDLLAGAGIGILSARVGYWLLPASRRLLGLDRKTNSSVALLPYYHPADKGWGCTLNMIL